MVIQNANSKVNTLLLAMVGALPVGLIFSSIYVTFKNGSGLRGLKDMDLLAFWYETPIHLGAVTDAFLVCLGIVAATSLIVPLILTVFLFKKKHFGTAQWARFQDMARAGYIKPYRKIAGPIFGRTSGPRGFGQYLTNGEQPHSLVVAPTRAGKGVGIVVPTLLTFNGSVLALDVKGELFEMTSRARLKRGDRIFKFSPLDKQGRTHCFNPVLDIVAMPPERRFTETRRLAVNLIEAKGKGAEGFIDGARDLFVAGVLACIERGNPTIGAVYDLFASPGEKYKLFAQLAEESSIPEVTRIFDNMAGNDTKIITSYTSVLGDGGLNLWADPMIKGATSRSDFSIYDLRRDPTSIYLCVSPNDLEVIAPLVRLFFQQVVSILQREMPGKDEIFEVLFLLDEFKHLGRLEAIETAVTTIAGYKGRFMFIIQSLSALTGAYEQAGKSNFLSNTGVQVFMATADDETPEYISKAIGEYTFTNKSTSYNQKEWWSANIQKSEQGALLMRPEQVRLVDDDKQIVLIKGRPPLHMHKVKYYSDRHLKRLFDTQTGELPEPKSLLGSGHADVFASGAGEPVRAQSIGNQQDDYEPDHDVVGFEDAFAEPDPVFQMPPKSAVEADPRPMAEYAEIRKQAQSSQPVPKPTAQTQTTQQSNTGANGGVGGGGGVDISVLAGQRELLQRIKSVQEQYRANLSD
ncbi:MULTISPECIES: type IV secretion system ATPase VirD4 [unclassified Ensifer]|uniref:type IV secretion system ATPase VirD4 n=1 Tax=unclassified Ensifer TaxID=2633371 RepID=UPI0009F5B2D6|nr:MULTISPECIES: type IV secretion system ATPase VirD4 [unclassified Ensifer]